MMFKQIVKKSLLLATMSCISPYVLANELYIWNYTSQPSTSKVIRKKSQYCTNRMPNGKGITQPGPNPNVISEGNINLACYGVTEECPAFVYMNDSCAEPAIGYVKFSVTKGILDKPLMLQPGYEIDAPIGSFNVVLRAKRSSLR